MSLTGFSPVTSEVVASGFWLAFDLVLIGAILWLAGAALLARDGFRMIVLFIVFGLLVALAWLRLRAPDVALAEAAIGTGLTGALLLKTWGRLAVAGDDRAARTDAPAPAVRRFLLAPLLALLTVALGLALIGAAPPSSVSTDGVAQNLDRSGVSNPVTAVLLNFRAYDTLLEIVVLLIAVVCVWLLKAAPAPAPRPELGLLFTGFARAVLPAMVVLAGYLLWLGAFAPGGAFQGGAVLAAVGILLVLGGRYELTAADEGRARLLLGAGSAAFIIAAVAAVGLGGAFLEYPQANAKQWILAIESVLTISIATTLAGLFYGRAPAGRSRPGRRP